MKHIFLMLAALAGGTAAAAPVVTVAVTTAMNPDTLTALCRASERLTGVITMRLVVRGVPVDAGFDVKHHFALAAGGISSFGGCIVQYKHRSPLDAVAPEKERINRNPAGTEV